MSSVHDHDVVWVEKMRDDIKVVTFLMRYERHHYQHGPPLGHTASHIPGPKENKAGGVIGSHGSSYPFISLHPKIEWFIQEVL